MAVLVDLLLWAHLVALGVGIGGGIGMSQVGPRLVAVAPDQRGAWWPMVSAFTGASSAALVVLLVTGPLIVWLKFGGFGGLSVWFHVKMGLVLLAIVAIGLSHMGKARLKRGDEGGGRLMAVSGPATMLLVLGIVLTAVLAFH